MIYSFYLCHTLKTSNINKMKKILTLLVMVLMVSISQFAKAVTWPPGTEQVAVSEHQIDLPVNFAIEIFTWGQPPGDLNYSGALAHPYNLISFRHQGKPVVFTNSYNNREQLCRYQNLSINKVCIGETERYNMRS